MTNEANPEAVYFAAINADESAPPLHDDNWARVPPNHKRAEPFYRYRDFAEYTERSYGYIRDAATDAEHGPPLHEYVVRDQGVPYVRFDATKLFSGGKTDENA